MDNFIIIAVILVIVGLAGAYVYKAKKKGVKCVGCPHSGSCSHNLNDSQTKCSGSCSSCSCCGSTEEN